MRPGNLFLCGASSNHPLCADEPMRWKMFVQDMAIDLGHAGLVAMRESDGTRASYGATDSRRRLLMDTFGESLKFVNRLYNKQFGTAARKVS